MSSDTTDYVAAASDADELELEPVGREFEAALAEAARAGTPPPAAAAFLARVRPELRDRFAELLDRLRRDQTPDEPVLDLPGYELIAVIARSNMGVVYKAREGATGREVVVKVLLDAARERAAREKAIWGAEGEVVAGLNHPNVVPVREVGSHNGNVFLVLPYVRGGNLRERMAEFSLAGVTDPKELTARSLAIARVLRQVASAVDHVHRRLVIHRDLKPSNILIDEHGDALVCDFGLARRLNEPLGLTISGQVVGTLLYMAPEQARGERVLTVAVDIWSIGAVLYELLTGCAPFCEDAPPYPTAQALLRRKLEDGATPPAPSEVNRTVPIDPDLEWICRRCLEHDPNKRFASAAELVEALRQFEEGQRVRPLASVGQWVRGAVAALAEHMNRPPAQADYIRRWRWALRAEACTSVVAHSTLFALVQSGAAAPWVWLAYLVGDTVIGFGVWHLIMRRSHRTGMERSLMQLWVGTDLTAVLWFAITVPLTRSLDAAAIATFYTAYLLMRGLAFFIEGRMCWGRLYLVSGAFYVAALAMPFAPAAAPLIYTGVYAGSFVWLSFCRWDAETETGAGSKPGARQENSASGGRT